MIGLFVTRQFAQFIVAGGISAAIHWLARLVLSLWLPFAWAVAAAYIVGMAFAFVLNSAFVFPQSDKSRPAQVRDFVLINLAFFPVVWAASLSIDGGPVALGMTRHTHELAHALAIPLPMFATFLLYKFLAFRERSYE